MRPHQKIILFVAGLFLSYCVIAQHPAREKIDSLKKQLQLTSGYKKIDCLNALSEEYWWPPLVYPDSISCWANEADELSEKLNYGIGKATASLHFGVSEIYRKKYLSAERFLRFSLQYFTSTKNNLGKGWCNLWLGQALFFENKFKAAMPLYLNSISYFSELKNYEGEGKAWSMMGFLYNATGNYDSSFLCFTKSMSIRKKIKDEVCVAASLTHIGSLYRSAGAVEEAVEYYMQGIEYANKSEMQFPATNWKYFLDEPKARIYQLRKMPDSSLIYLKHALMINKTDYLMQVYYGEILLLKNMYDSALNYFGNPIIQFRKDNNKWDLVRVLLLAAKAFYGKGMIKESQSLLQESLLIAKEADLKPIIAEGYYLLSKVYQYAKKYDSAYFFLEKSIALKEKITSNHFLWRLTNYKNQIEYEKQINQITILDKDNVFKEEKLKQAAKLKILLIAGLIIVALSGFIFYRNLNLNRQNDRLENQKIQSELQQRSSELEMKALRSQMNPHFIFNCLNSINSFILKNETEAASDYLTKFSKLIRMVLTYSNKTFISLEDELLMLQLYLDMEQLRFKGSFEFSIIESGNLDTGNIFIPPLLIQPFIENAIWHGLMHKETDRKLEIIFSGKDRNLTCIIKDNGIGRKKASEIKNKSGEHQKSMGLRITAERLSLINKHNKGDNYFEIEDLKNKEGDIVGTQVKIKINYKELNELET